MRVLLVSLLLCGVVAGDGPERRKKEGPLDRGATKESEEAVARGLRWLALHQAADGSWSLHSFNRNARTEPIPKGKVKPDDSTPETSRNNATAGTAMALLPFLAAGHTHKAKAGPYQRTVQAGLSSLVKRQTQAGRDKGFLGGDTYSHALGVIALADAYKLTKDPAIKGPAQFGINYLIAAQHEGGGWRYSPRQAGDTSVTGFVIRALVAGKRAGLIVPKKVLAAAGKYLDSATTADKQAGYLPGAGGTPTMTAAATYCRLLLGATPRDATVQAGVKHILKGKAPAMPLYLGFYAQRALYEVGGDAWDEWNAGKASFRDSLVKSQDDGKGKAGNAGSWKGDDHVGGRIGATSFALLSLLVYREERWAAVPKVEP